MKGYWKNAAATRESIVDGWFRTGDAGYLRDGYLYIHDRVKDMIVSGGENIYPAEIERLLIALPGVADVVVVRKPDPKWGEVPVAFVVPRADCTLTEEKAIAACEGRIARYKIPREVRFVAETDLRRSASGKIVRGDLEVLLRREMAEAAARREAGE
jgi:fatty-acyl-CoA synthase